MSLSTSITQLNAALKDMRVCWDQVRPQWNDRVQQRLEEEHWEPLEAQVRAAIKGMEGVALVVERMRREIPPLR
jgi:hypothetical protein